VTGGRPNGTVRAARTLANAWTLLPSPLYPASPFASFEPIYLGTSVSGSTDFAIVLSALPDPAVAGSGSCGMLLGPVGDPYPGGDAFSSGPSGTWNPLGGPAGTRFDIPFEVMTAAPGTPAVSVFVLPTTASVFEGQTLAFAARVVGTSNRSVDWAVVEGLVGGTVDLAGNYAAPYTPGLYHLVATSRADLSATATATVTVPGPAPLAITVTPSPSAFADPVTVDVRFTAAPGSPMPNGTVTVSDVPRPSALGATGFAAVSGTIACTQAPASPWVCSASFPLGPYAWFIGGTHSVSAAYAGDPNHSPGSSTVDTFVDISVPSLAAAGLSSRPTGGTDYFLRLANWYEYADEAFQAQAGPPCGSSPSSSRTWVEILDGTTGVLIARHCAFTSRADLRRFPFFAAAGVTPPTSLRVRVTDFVRSVTFESNVVPLPMPVTVTVAPATATTRTGWTQSFVETVTGTTDTWVDWTTSGGGTVDWYGNYTATTPGTYVVTATSAADPSASGSATVTVIDGATPYVATTTTTLAAPAQAWLGTGQTVTLTAKVTWTDPTNPAVPAGRVTFNLAPARQDVDLLPVRRECGMRGPGPPHGRAGHRARRGTEPDVLRLGLLRWGRVPLLQLRPRQRLGHREPGCPVDPEGQLQWIRRGPGVVGRKDLRVRRKLGQSLRPAH
jgi:hypothetical protein